MTLWVGAFRNGRCVNLVFVGGERCGLWFGIDPRAFILGIRMKENANDGTTSIFIYLGCFYLDAFWGGS